jgi:hypothetical protein
MAGEHSDPSAGTGSPGYPQDAPEASTPLDATESQDHDRKRVRSPKWNPTAEVEPTHEPPQRSRARVNEFDRGPANKPGRLWTPDDTSPKPQTSTRVRHTASSQTKSRATPQPSAKNIRLQTQRLPQTNDAENTELIKEPETRPISQEQLVAEVKGIYAGLVMVESKCIDVDNAQNSNADGNHQLNNEQWQALIALHRTLLHEHHDFFLASQHPAASPALRRLASKYAMPARMWRHGIHSFLELLRHRLPASLEHMLTFIYLAYSMMALLYETVPTFEDTWIECLGDLGRYR